MSISRTPGIIAAIMGVLASHRSKMAGSIMPYLEDGQNKIRRPGPGWSAAHVKRMAAKKRNQQRHKLACRKAGARK